MAKALGMIETRGLIGSIEAADAMIKAADVSLVNQEKVDGALVAVLVEGDVGAVQAAVEAGKKAAEQVGELIACHVIAHPDVTVGTMLATDKRSFQGPAQQNTTLTSPKVKDQAKARELKDGNRTKNRKKKEDQENESTDSENDKT
ncbi:hypothetical protein GCM10010965_23140 [Caldalkalibacillus thermarum]|uniref:BMC domain-containing protein n=1 Tax=Caldalkalibacillus thermarum TaxID=296745 RepID=UPI00166811D6|nr:BMC domain-containing protein [Caldalkalibacillus thermarum]GGK29654.1 hypothetical protein GCM10010965_23140 [Caldalkalibacillus thermarum]